MPSHLCKNAKYFLKDRKHTYFDSGFYNVSAKVLAVQLLGKVLVKMSDGLRIKGVIVETEAYLGPHDLASHASKRRKSDNLLHPGIAQLTKVYGIHTVLSLSCLGDGCVLIRALEPVFGLHWMVQNLGLSSNSQKIQKHRICSGPGKLCKALSLTTALHYYDIGQNFNKLYITGSNDEQISADSVVQCPRIGLSKEKVGEWYHKRLRYYILNHPSVSKRHKKYEKELLSRKNT